MILGKLHQEGRACAYILYVDLPPMSYSQARGKTGLQAWTLSPHGLKGHPGPLAALFLVLLALAEPPQLCKPFLWELKLPGLSASASVYPLPSKSPGQ